MENNYNPLTETQSKDVESKCPMHQKSVKLVLGILFFAFLLLSELSTSFHWAPLYSYIFLGGTLATVILFASSILMNRKMECVDKTLQFIALLFLIGMLLKDLFLR